MRLFTTVLLLCSNLFSWELACPQGCGGPEDPDRIAILDTVAVCIERLGITRVGIKELTCVPYPEGPEGAFACDTFPVAELSWWINTEKLAEWDEVKWSGQEWYPPIEGDYKVSRLWERYALDWSQNKIVFVPPPEETFYKVNKLPDTLAIFEALRSDIDFIYQQNVSNNQLYIEKNTAALKIPFTETWCIDRKELRWELNDCKRKIQEAILDNNKYHKEIDASIKKVCKQYDRIYKWCIEHHGWQGALYERGLLSFYQGMVFNAIQDISKFIEASKKANSEDLLPSEAYLAKGSLELEIGKYNDAIESLSAAIAKDPKNRKAYFERAAAYFETGAFELALQDYLAQQVSSGNATVDSWDFAAGLTIGAGTGMKHAFKEFLPSMFAFAKGLGNMVWTKLSSPEFQKAFVEHAGEFSQACEEYFSHPIDETSDAYELLAQAFGPKLKQMGGQCADAFAHPIQSAQESYGALKKTSADFFEMLQSCSKEDLARYLPAEFYTLVTQWDSLNEFERGQIMGYGCGKYSTDVLLPIAVIKGVKGVQALRELQAANKACTLETLASTAKKEESLAKVATELSEEQKRAAIAFIRDQKKEYLKPWQGKYMDEVTIRKILVEGEMTPPLHPPSIPNKWRPTLSDKPGGISYVHPETTQEYVRTMPGNPNSPNPCQQRPYAVQMHHGKAVDANGNLVPPNSPEAHIPLEEFVYREIK